MSLSRKQLALLHVAKAKLGITDAEYRATLVHIAGVTSAKELTGPDFDAVMGFFEYLGFKPLAARGADYGARPGMASFAQLELIRALWSEYTHGQADEDALNKWLSGTWKIASLRFLRKDTAQKAITALKAMKARAA